MNLVKRIFDSSRSITLLRMVQGSEWQSKVKCQRSHVNYQLSNVNF